MAVDVMDELPLTKSGNKCVLVVMDYFTKFLHLIPVPDQKAVTVANAMVKEVFTKVGIPRFFNLTGVPMLCLNYSKRHADCSK